MILLLPGAKRETQPLFHPCGKVPPNMTTLLENLLLIGLPLLLALFWHSSMRARERATTLARLTCDNYGAQLLDQTVALCHLGLSRNGAGHLQFKRNYRFDYSYDGEMRLQGEVVLHGLRSDLITLVPPGTVNPSDESSDNAIIIPFSPHRGYRSNDLPSED